MSKLVYKRLQEKIELMFILINELFLFFYYSFSVCRRKAQTPKPLRLLKQFPSTAVAM